MNKNTYYATTPIYYTNWIPHIGHAYSSIIADTITRYKKINWFDIKFSTWVDENSQKAVSAASDLWMETMPYLDMMAKKHKAVWDWLNIKYTDFIRTTEKRHHKLVSEVLKKSFNKKNENWKPDIYEGEYEWMYCVWCEWFKKDEDLVYMSKETGKTFPISDKVKVNENIIKVCPDHLKTPDLIKEKNWFFRLSKYEDKLLKYYEENPEFVVPSDRFNEVKAFVKRWLDDFSISRETNKFGIKLPFDPSQVTYVWYDALFNYMTVCDENDKWQSDMKFWPADLHVVWKDIIRFHAIYWPAMLMSAWYELPKKILTTGFMTVDWQKISKSLWNVIDPVEFSANYSKDLLTLYLLTAFNIWQDWDFDQKQAVLMYNAKLANNLGNLVNRVVVLSLKLGLENGLKWEVSHENLWIFSWFDYEVASLGFSLDEWVKSMDWSIRLLIEQYNDAVNSEFSRYNLKSVLDLSFFFLDKLNKYVDIKEPWYLIKDDSRREEVIEIFYTIAEWLRQVWLNLYAFFPEKMWELFIKLGLENYVEQLEEWKLEELRNKTEVFNIKEKGDALFGRVEVK